MTSGQATNVVADLTRAAAVRTVIRDAATGEPVEGACIALVEPLSPPDRRAAASARARTAS